MTILFTFLFIALIAIIWAVILDEKKKPEQIRKLVDVGYSEPMAKQIVNMGKFDIAYALGCESEVNMDTKIQIIFKDEM